MWKRVMLAGMMFAAGAAGDAAAQGANRISVEVVGLRNDQGMVHCGLYASADDFRKPGKEFKGVAVPILGRRAVCVFNDAPPGTYAVAVFHAEHNETQLETGLFGKPRQGYGFSRDAKGSFGPPSFGEAAYAYPGGRTNWTVHIEY